MDITMLFQYTWQHVIEETKTQTRRPVKPGEYAIRTYCNQIAAVFQSNSEKWRVGSDYAVQIGRGSHQIGRIRLLRIRSEYLTRISTADAYAEGFENRQADRKSTRLNSSHQLISYAVF